MRDGRRILLVSLDDPRDPRSWSGAPNNVLRALERQVGPLAVLSGVPITRRIADSAMQRLLGPDRYLPWMTIPALDAFGRAFAEAVEEINPDGIISISSQYLVRCPVEILERFPIVMFTDCPWQQGRRSYEKFARRCLFTDRYGRMEAAVARRITATVYASQWSTDWLAESHGIPREKLHAIPFGANLVPKSVLPPRAAPPDQIRLLFVGVDWRRKGGSFAVDVTRALRGLGRDARLDVVGCNPKLPKSDRAFVTVHGVLAMNSEAEKDRLVSLYESAHLLLVPTRAECFGIVFAEAGAFGIPSVAGGVDAVPFVIEDGANGLLIGESEEPQMVAARILSLMIDSQRYERMAAIARERYEMRFNWDVFARGLLDALDGRSVPRN